MLNTTTVECYALSPTSYLGKLYITLVGKETSSALPSCPPPLALELID